MQDALQGIKVVDLSHVIAGPMASNLLAMLGADVIKVESPVDGDPLRHSRRGADANSVPPAFAALNQHKRSCALDIRDPRSRAHVLTLMQRADVVIENFRPRVVARYGLDYATVAKVNPGIVYCSVSGYGQSGAWRDRPAYDHVVQAAAGMMMINGFEGGPPVKTGFPLIDTATGLLAAFSISAALTRRARDGMGTHLDVSMIQGALQLMLPTAAAALTSGRNPERTGNAGWLGSPGADTFQCADGFIAVAANTFAQIGAAARVLQLDDIVEEAARVGADNPGRFARRSDIPSLHARLQQACASCSAESLEVRLNASGVPAAQVRTLIDVLRETADLSFGGLDVHRVRGADGSAFVPGLRLTADHAGGDASYPAHGQHTRAVLQEIGVSVDDIDALVALGLATCAEPLPAGAVAS